MQNTIDNISSMLTALGRSSSRLTMGSTLADVKCFMSAEGFVFSSDVVVLTGESCEETSNMKTNVQTNVPVHMWNVDFGPVVIGFVIANIPEGICIRSVTIPGECHFEFSTSDPIFSLEKLVGVSEVDGLFAEVNNYVMVGPKTSEILAHIHKLHGRPYDCPGKEHEKFITLPEFSARIV